MNNEVLSQNIVKFRKLKNLSQQQLAERLFITAQSVSKWEQGKALPDVQKLCALAEIFGVSLDVLVGNEKNDEGFLVAVDGGGTKTEFLLLNNKGEIKNQILLSGSNPNVVGAQITFEIIKKGIEYFCVPKEKIIGVFVGIAGCGVSKNKEKISYLLNECYPDAKIQVNSDIFNVLGTVEAEQNSVAAISGTGSTVCAYSNNSLHRIGGWGYLFESKGSGFAIGRDALNLTLSYEDGLEENSLVAQLVQNRLGSTVWEKLDEIYKKGQREVASFAPLVFEAYKKDDKKANEILEQNYKYFASLINLAFEKYNCSNSVILSGGLLKEREVIVPIIKKYLSKEVKIIVPEFNQIYGAGIQCLKLCGIDNSVFRKTFEKEYRRKQNEKNRTKKPQYNEY